MFGSTSPFGQQSSNSPFGTQSVFGQSSTTNNNPFTPQPFGSTTPSPFGAQTGSSLFGGTSTGMFGNTQSTPFGAPSTPAFGSTTFGASSTSSPFGTPSNTQASPFGGAAGTSAFGQKPAFGFGSTPAPSSPFGNTAQPSQSAFGSNVFGNTTSSPFGGSQSAFNTNTSSAFGGTSTTAFGATGTPAFGTNTTPGFGVPGNTAFGQGTTAFGTTSTSPFGGTTGSAFGTTPSTPTFGTTPSPTFGNTASPFGATTSTNMFNSGTGFGVPSSTSPFGQSSSAFGTSTSAPAFGASTTPSLGASSPFGSSQFGASSGYGAQSSPFGVQSTTPTVGNTPFGQSNFGGQRGGSRVTPYTGTSDTEGGGTGTNMGKLESISAMPVYKDKSHEELRWEDYQSGDKGGPSPAGVSSFGVPNAQTNPNPAPSFSQPSSNPFNASTTSNPFAQKTPSFTPSSGFNTSPTPFSSSSNPTSLFTPASSSPFGQTSTSAFGQTSASPFGQTSSTPFGQTSSTPFGQSSSTPFGQSSPSLFSNTSAAQSFSFSNPTSSSGFFNPTPSNAQTPFGQTATTSFGLNQTNFGGNLFNTSSGLLGSSSANTSNQIGTSQPPSSFPTFQQSQLTQNSPFGFTNAFGQTQTGNTSGFNGAAGILGQSNFLQPSSTQVSAAVQQPVPATNPFGTLPAMPHMSIGRGGTAPSIQYGISSMPVVDKPSTVRVTSVLTPRHLSQRRIRLPARKYNPKNDSPKVPFFSDDEETPSTPKGDVVFQPRENPRALVIRPKEQWPLRASADKASPNRNSSAPVHENGKKSGETLIGGSNAEDKEPGTLQEDGFYKEHTHVKANLKPNGVHDDHSVPKGDSYATLSGQRAGEAAIAYEHGADIEAQMPKLRLSDYYTEPRIQELAAKERSEPGFCSRVKDFVVGRRGYGSIKFLGETDVRRLDLDALVQFNSKEVIVYQDDNKKPPVGQGLNKPAEVTLLNIKCIEKKTGLQYTEGPKVEKYKEMLKRKAEEQGAKFVSYDAKKEEWTFMVNHFSAYELRGEEDWEVDATQDY